MHAISAYVNGYFRCLRRAEREALKNWYYCWGNGGHATPAEEERNVLWVAPALSYKEMDANLPLPFAAHTWK